MQLSRSTEAIPLKIIWVLLARSAIYLQRFVQINHVSKCLQALLRYQRLAYKHLAHNQR